MKISHLFTLFLNTLAICLLVFILIYGESNENFLIEENGETSTILTLHKLLILPIAILIYNSFVIIKKTTDSNYTD